jgi:hypothetical protein
MTMPHFGGCVAAEAGGCVAEAAGACEAVGGCEHDVMTNATAAMSERVSRVM